MEIKKRKVTPLHGDSHPGDGCVEAKEVKQERGWMEERGRALGITFSASYEPERRRP